MELRLELAPLRVCRLDRGHVAHRSKQADQGASLVAYCLALGDEIAAFARRPQDAIFHGARDLAVRRGAIRFGKARPVLRMDQRQDVLAGDDETAFLDAVNIVEIVRPGEGIAVPVPFEAADLGQRQGARQVALALAQARLALAQLRGLACRLPGEPVVDHHAGDAEHDDDHGHRRHGDGEQIGIDDRIRHGDERIGL